MKILIIDDSPADRELTIRLLERDFADAEFVEIGRKPDFYAALANGVFDAVLTDFRLHWADGFLILSEVKAARPYVPVVFITESGSEEIAVEAMKAGLSDYVLKQHPQRLAVALRESMEKARLRQGYDAAQAELQSAHTQLQQSAQELERRVTERTAQLARINDDLRSEMAYRRQAQEERERLLAENRQQRELLEHLIAAAPVGIALIRADDFRYEFANPAYLAITGKPADPRGQQFGSITGTLTALRSEVLAPISETGQPVSIREFEREAVGLPGGRDYWDIDAVPVHNEQDKTTGILLLINDVTQKVRARTQVEDLALELVAARDQLELRVQERTAELEASQAELRALSHHLVTVQENERKALSRELHDRSAQSITTLKLGLAMLKRKAEDTQALRARVDELIGMADGVLSDLHELAVNLRPSSLDRYGLASALEQYVDAYRKHNRVEVDLTIADLEGQRMPEEVETALYRIVQESLMNVARHARATRAEIAAVRSQDKVSLKVSDNGRGFDVETALQRGRLGLLGMRERAEMLGGRLEIVSGPGTGTTVHLEVPVAAGPREG